MSRPRRAGTAWETAVRDYLAAHGHPYAERLALAGNRDRGDLTGLPGWLVECKAVARLELGDWMTAAEHKAARVGADPVIIVKRRHRPAARAYAVVPLEVWARVLAADEETSR